MSNLVQETLEQRLVILEARITELERTSASWKRVVGQLHSYMQRIYDAVSVGANLKTAFDYAITKNEAGPDKQYRRIESQEELDHVEELARVAREIKGRLTVQKGGVGDDGNNYKETVD